MGKRTVRCHAHCRSCNRHFATDLAFDRHRQGPWDDRRCVDPAEVKALGAKSYTGVCELAPGYVKCVGPVWTLARSLHGSADRLEGVFALNRSGSEAA